MKVFISWSGDLSHKVALAFREWLPSVIQSLEPYVSSEDIDKGKRWSSDLASELAATSVGMICVTRENLTSAWVNYESGALSKLLDETRVMPFLFGLKKSEVQGPLAQFQMTIYEKPDVFKMLKSINEAFTPHMIEESKLVKAFDRWWPDLEQALNPLVAEAEQLNLGLPKERRVSDSEILEELLELARSQHNTLANSAFIGISRNDLPFVLRDFSHPLRLKREEWDAIFASWQRLRVVLEDIATGHGRTEDARAVLMNRMIHFEHILEETLDIQLADIKTMTRQYQKVTTQPRTPQIPEDLTALDTADDSRKVPSPRTPIDRTRPRP